MARVLTNETAIGYAIEASRGVLPGSPTWKTLEPNDITQFGAEITSVPRSPISRLRQRRKGAVVDKDSGFEYEADTTMDVMVDFIEGFIMATAVNGDLRFRGANVGASGYTIPAATAAQGNKLQFNSGGATSLVWAAGYVNSANNGLKVLTADTGTGGTTIAFAGSVVETAPTNAEVNIAGIRGNTGGLAITVSGGLATLTSGAGSGGTPMDFTTLGLTVGQRIHIGGLTLTEQFSAGFGSARIRTIAAATMTLDKLDAGLVTDPGTGDTVDLLFGRFIRNVPTNSAEFLERYYQFEAESPNLFETEPPTPVANPDGFEYSIGNLANEMAWAMPLTDKSTCTFGFVGTDTEPPVDNASRKTNASTPILPLFTGALNTSSDFIRLRIADVDDTGLTTDFKDMTATFRNNVGPEKVLGFLGAKYMNFGNFEVDIETEVLFTKPEIPDRILNYTTVTMDWLVTNDDGAIAVDIPSMTMSSDGKSFPINESVRIGLNCEAFVDQTFGTSIGVSLFPVYPVT